MSTYPRAYAALKRSGHSPLKALEILIDAKRGNRYALRWIRICARTSAMVAAVAVAGCSIPPAAPTAPTVVYNCPEVDPAQPNCRVATLLQP